jgi:thiamine-monophosphate kinase
MRLDRPEPRVAPGLALAGVAHAAIDVSDGLLADLGHICVASDVGAEIELARLPASPLLCERFDHAARAALQASGGDDYELCFTAAQSQRDAIDAIASTCGVALTRIGRIVPGSGVRALLADGREWTPEHPGFAHFR